MGPLSRCCRLCCLSSMICDTCFLVQQNCVERMLRLDGMLMFERMEILGGTAMVEKNCNV